MKEHLYQVGDRVRICSKWNEEAARYVNNAGEMDHWRGKVMTIRSFAGRDYKMEEDEEEHDGIGWYWMDCMIEGLAEGTPSADISDDFLSLVY